MGTLGMSEEAVRQTRRQKRVLERDSSYTESSNIDNESKKTKLDSLEASLQAQTKTKNTSGPEDGHSEHQANFDLDTEPRGDQTKFLPSAAPSAKTPEPQRQIDEASTDNQTERKDTPSNWKTEVSDTKVPTETAGMTAVGEVEATIKVEVQAADQPVDMTTTKGIKKEKRSKSSEDDDVIILSDNDSPSKPMNGMSHMKELNTDLLLKSSPEEREHIIKQLKEELRLEEAKLILLKKLRHSQIQRDTIQKSSGSSAPPPLIRGALTSSKGSQQILAGRNSSNVIPPPLVRGGQQISSKSQVIMPPLVRGAQQIQALRQQQQQQLAAANSGSGPPPLLLGPRSSASTSQNQRGVVQSGFIRVGGNTSVLTSSGVKGNSSVSGLSVLSVNDSPASRQAAAKLALRKQLENTLLEIPPPKPPAPDFNFLPSAANNEFIYLVGLEEVVQNLLDNFHRGKTGTGLLRHIARDPFICTQCKTDFTSRWRQDKVKGGKVLCEDCMSSNQKKALKTEHTNRLKAAFVKALQQEQEIDQCIIQASSTLSHSSTSSLKTDHLASQQLKQARVSSLQQQHNSSRGPSLVHHQSIKQSSHSQLLRGSVSSISVRGVPHSFSSSSQLQSAVAAAALVSRPGVTMAYVNPSLTGQKTSAVDARHREYLLDMIPSRSSISQTANTWK